MRKRLQPLFVDKTGIEYSPERDGDLKTYLESRDGRATTYVFKGFKHYKMLWENGYFTPGSSYLRFMWNNVIDDEIFQVRGLYEIEGNDANFLHKAGIHDPAEVLEEGILFEVHCLNPNPVPRVMKKKKR